MRLMTPRKIATRPRNQSRKTKPAAKGDGFTVSSAVDKATGKHDHLDLDTVRALPGPKPDTVVLQASDGHQAVCVVFPGELDQAAAVPSRLLRNHKTTEHLEVTRASGGAYPVG